MNQVHSPEAQRNVLDLYQAGIPVAEIVLRTGISRSRVYAYISSANLPRQRKKSDPADDSECAIQDLPILDNEVEKRLKKVTQYTPLSSLR